MRQPEAVYDKGEDEEVCLRAVIIGASYAFVARCNDSDFGPGICIVHPHPRTYLEPIPFVNDLQVRGASISRRRVVNTRSARLFCAASEPDECQSWWQICSEQLSECGGGSVSGARRWNLLLKLPTCSLIAGSITAQLV